MARTALDEGEWGAISTHQAPDGRWAAQARLHDPVRKKVVQVRRFGESPEHAEEVLTAELMKRSTAAPLTQPEDASTFGDVLAWWWLEARPRHNWSETTNESMAYARKQLERFADRPWSHPDDAATLVEELDDNSRTTQLAVRLLWHVARDVQNSVPF